MVKFKKKLILAIACLLCISTLVPTLAGCTGGNQETTTTTTTNTQTDNPGVKKGYTVKVSTIGGMALKGVSFDIYKADGSLAQYGTTDEQGIATVELPEASGYYVTLKTGNLEGYKVEEKYPFNGNSVNIVLSSSVITETTNLDGKTYKLGDVMRDFTVTTVDGEKFTLSEVLKEKKMVLINFWYTECGPCVSEIPYMQSSYEKYSDNVALIGLNHYDKDTEDRIKVFAKEQGITFDLAKDFTKLGTAFNVLAYPTSIVIDRYGVICLIEAGALPSETPFNAIFNHFTAIDYKQKLINSVSELTPKEKPNVPMPSQDEINAAFNKGQLNVTFTGETDEDSKEYAWPFIIGEHNGEAVVMPSNSKKDGSFAALHATVELKAGQALAFDWFASTEQGNDILAVFIDNKDIYQISGVSDDYQTCYPFVALEDGTYKLILYYLKNDGGNVGEDTVYLKNLRAVDVSTVDSPTYIPRDAATNLKEDGFGYENYVTVVYNEKDGYYHVGSENGPLLLVNLMEGTLFSGTSINDYGYNGKLVDNGTDLYEILVDYCNYAVNSQIYGLCPVTKELRDLLMKSVDLVGIEDDPNEWLQTCCYYDAYGTNGIQLTDPIKGQANFSAFEAVESSGNDGAVNSVTFDRVIMPRGLKFKFTPEKSGVYRIVSHADQRIDAWIFLEDGTIALTYEIVDRILDDEYNCNMVYYMEAGTTYYINLAYYDIYAVGTFTFTLSCIGEKYAHFKAASPGYFTYEETSGGDIGDLVTLGIDVVLGDDGYYHEDLGDGKLGSIVYADFTYTTGIFTSQSLMQLIEMNAFDFRYSEMDHDVLTWMKKHGDNTVEYLKGYWGDAFDEYYALYKVDDVMNGIYHGTGVDETQAIKAYLDRLIEKTEEAPELEGCVAVDAELARILQLLMDKYTFEGAEHSWTKVCYYYDYLGNWN